MTYDPKHDKAIRDIIYHDWSERRKMSEDQQAQLEFLRPLRAACKECRMCRLGRIEHAHNDKPLQEPHVFSNMNPTKFMVVGQNPGFNECIKDEPFVGDSGEFFNMTIEEHGLSRNDFYITNIVKCHTPENRKPETDELEACQTFLRMEIKAIKPKLTVTLGTQAFEVLCPNLVYSSSLGKIVKSDKFDVSVYPVYHPSPRNMVDPSRKKKFEADIADLCALIKALSISSAPQSAPVAPE
jgi:DNA polymerase